MYKLKTILSAAIVLLVTWVIAGCATTTETVYIKPECSVPIHAPLPKIDAGELWDITGDDLYQEIVLREKLIVDWADEMRLMLEAICKN